jgi:CHASE2 domain
VSRAAPELGWALAGAIAIGAAVALWRSDPPVAAAVTDWQLRAAAADAPPAGVLVLDIDDATLAELKPRLGAWPYPRDVYALAIEQLRDLGAKAIAIDLLLADTHEGDAALARAIERPGAPVVLAAAGLRHASDGVAAPRVPPGGAALIAATRWPAMALPAESLWPAAHQPPRWVGVITTPLDADGRLRHLPLQHHALGRDWPALPLAVLQATGGVVSATWPLDAQGRATIPFPVEARHEAQTVPFARLAKLALGGWCKAAWSSSAAARSSPTAYSRRVASGAAPRCSRMPMRRCATPAWCARRRRGRPRCWSRWAPCRWRWPGGAAPRRRGARRC